jgi:hypothetical protein
MLYYIVPHVYLIFSGLLAERKIHIFGLTSCTGWSGSICHNASMVPKEHDVYLSRFCTIHGKGADPQPYLPPTLGLAAGRGPPPLPPFLPPPEVPAGKARAATTVIGTSLCADAVASGSSSGGAWHSGEVLQAPGGVRV